MKNPLSIVSIILMVFITSLFCGEYGDSFLRLGVSARAIAMGNSIGSLDTTETAFISNPAGLAYQDKFRIGIMYTSQFGLADHNYIGLSLPVLKKPQTSLTFSWVRFQVGDLIYRPNILVDISDPEARRDSVISFANKPFSTFQERDEAIFISLARLFNKNISLGWKYANLNLNIPIGLNFKIIRKQLADNRGTGLGLDLGTGLKINGAALTNIYNFGDLYLGLSIRDLLGTTIYWNTKKQDRISRSTIFSLAFAQPLKFYNSILNLCSEIDTRYNTYRLGVEFDLNRKIAFRTGLNDKQAAIGLGLKFHLLSRLIHLDYSFKSHDLGATHRIGGGLAW
ncbi:MAG: hypothetical protein K9M80_02800 [Candidatus Marinimicrobia bacterium]|nr:hypothetical protein [Candidatus Neomarinimicrobiota bacterium]